ncbi:MAG: reverse gyrase, partial [Thermoprotei archaeon]
LTNSSKKKAVEAISQGEFDILITTSQFLSRNFNLLRNIKFDFIFVDDVDALLKSSRNIDRVLILLGFSQEIVDTALQLIYSKRRLAFYIVSNRQVPSDLSQEIEELEKEIDDYILKNKHGVLVVSTATGRVRGLRSRLFRELLGFEVGSRAELLRNVADIYLVPRAEPEEELVKLVGKLGNGGLVFIPVDLGIEKAKEIAEKLREAGVRAKAAYSGDSKAVDDFINGEVDVLVGVAVYYGTIVRGLDLPEKIRYAVFLGVPRFRFSISVEESHPLRLLSIALNLREYLPEKDAEEIDRLARKLRRQLISISSGAIQELARALRENGELQSPRLNSALDTILLLQEKLRALLSRRDVIERLKAAKYISVKEEEGGLYIYIPDTMTYLQASGRTSRMYAGGISKGLSIVIVDDEKLFNGLVRQSRWYSDDIEWQSINEADLDKVIEEVDRDREAIKAIREGRVKAGGEEPLRTALLIVESPNKARTISGFYGRPSRKHVGNITIYEVTAGKYMLNVVASGGHVFDLVTKEGFHGVLKLNGNFLPIYTSIKRCLKCGAQFTDLDQCPICKSGEYMDTYSTIDSLKEIVKEVDVVLIGTDPDTEGEKIGWDVATVLAPYSKDIKRIEFHEITKRAISNAIENPRELSTRLVEAQIVRRIEDRWIGFTLSQKLWRIFGSRWYSAGRVQTPVLGWIVDRYNEYRRSKRYVFRITLSNGCTVNIEDPAIKNTKEARENADKLMHSDCRLLSVTEEEVTIKPPPPFSTDSMLREAVSTIRIGVDEVMRLAQDLFEMGLITYHRTDSIRVSDVGRAIAREYIREQFSEDDFKPREWSKEGAHECIRPTRPIDAD